MWLRASSHLQFWVLPRYEARAGSYYQDQHRREGCSCAGTKGVPGEVGSKFKLCRRKYF